MQDVSEVHERLFREGNSDTKFGAFRTKFWRETVMAGIAKSTIADVLRENGGTVEERWKNGGMAGNRQIKDRRCPRGSSKKGSLLKGPRVVSSFLSL